jgi:hypothetical protein
LKSAIQYPKLKNISMPGNKGRPVCSLEAISEYFRLFDKENPDLVSD